MVSIFSILLWKVRNFLHSDLLENLRLLIETSSFIHRPAILNGLIAATSPNVKVHLGHRLKEYKMLPDGKVQLLFTNGSVGTCDLLVGADGLKSVVRKHFFETAGTPAEIDLLWSGVYAHRSMIDSKTVQEKRPNHRVLSTPTIVRLPFRCLTITQNGSFHHSTVD